LSKESRGEKEVRNEEKREGCDGKKKQRAEVMPDERRKMWTKKRKKLDAVSVEIKLPDLSCKIWLCWWDGGG
jgi:hypothetical protein